MTRRDLIFYTGILVILGAGWGATMPLTKTAVSTGHQHFGLIFWQLVIGAVFMGGISAIRGVGLPFTRATLRVYLAVAIIGTLLPNSASYQAITHLPSGVMSILLSLVPMMAFPIALGLGLERFSWRRFLGLFAGLAGVLLLVLPEASLPDRSMLVWIPIAVLPALCYGFEGNYVARWGTAGLDAIQVLFGASLLGALIMLPVAVISGQFISPIRSYGAPEWALIASSIVHVLSYTGYVWLVGRAGPVFTVQVSYLVTGFGILAAIVFLDETYSPYIWAALGLVLVGIFLVQPRRYDPLAEPETISDTAR